jgi:hypothetical protein
MAAVIGSGSPHFFGPSGIISQPYEILAGKNLSSKIAFTEYR